MKNPIFSFVVPVVMFGLWSLLYFGVYGFFFLLRVFGIYLIFFLISYYLKENKYPKRLLVEWMLILIYIIYFLYFFYKF